jgi:hypothetical protein
MRVGRFAERRLFAPPSVSAPYLGTCAIAPVVMERSQRSNEMHAGAVRCPNQNVRFLIDGPVNSLSSRSDQTAGDMPNEFWSKLSVLP